MARFVTRKEAEGRKFRLRVFAGMFDFLATIGSLMLIFACVALLASLATWIRNDAKTTFASIEYSITSALIMPRTSKPRSHASAPAMTAGALFSRKKEGKSACAFPGVPCSAMCVPVKNAASAGAE